MEFSIAGFTLFCIEMRGDEIDTSRIAYEDHFIGELLGFEMEMKDRAVGVDDEPQNQEILSLSWLSRV